MTTAPTQVHPAASIPPVDSAAPTERRALDTAIALLRSNARAFARMPPAEKAALVRACLPRIVDTAEVWVATGCKAKGLAGDARGEEWVVGPLPTVRLARLLGDSLEAIGTRGRPPLGTGGTTRPDGRVELDVFPVNNHDRVAFRGFRGSVLLQPGIDRDAAAHRQASFYRQRDPEGGVALVLGAGNVSSIPPMDVLSKMFVEGFVCLLKMNPVNEWAGPILERALGPLVERGFLRIVYGGADVGQYLVEHEGIDDVHITGSDQTHDRIVWGPPGPERARRQAAGDPLLAKPISSELGNISPVVIVPYDYRDRELAFLAEHVATMITNNASFNCNAAKVVITSPAWAQRDAFWGLVARALAATPPRQAYYPGAFERYAKLTAGRELHVPGAGADGCLPWTIVRGVDPAATDALFTTEPFCAIVTDVALGTGDPIEMMAAAVRWCNDRLWGTLNAALFLPPALEDDPTVAAALDRAIVDLRYGTVGINQWPAVAYGVGSLPWGGHPSATLRDIQSGLGWVHNSFMLEGIDKAILRGPLVVRPRPLWFSNHPKSAAVAKRMMEHEASPSWRGLARVVAAML